MRLLFALASSLFALAAVAEEPAWQSLFDGKSMDGWVQRGGKATYTVEDGCIVGTSVMNTGNSFLCTAEEYGNFILEYEFKVDPALNSGVQFRSKSAPDFKNGRVHGYQSEIDNDNKRKRFWSAGIYDEGDRGWLFPKGKEAEKAFSAQGAELTKAEDWNHVRIEARGDEIKTFFNGVPRAELKDDHIAKGFIALQVHGIGGNKALNGKQVRWRNLRIQVLD